MHMRGGVAYGQHGGQVQAMSTNSMRLSEMVITLSPHAILSEYADAGDRTSANWRADRC